MKEDYKTWPLCWSWFPEETFTTNWVYIGENLEVTFSEVSSGLIPINQLMVKDPRTHNWVPLQPFTLLDKTPEEDI